ncbi:RagB/SusD family nutrient uptake outer membrane protein [Ekhidna sp.]
MKNILIKFTYIVVLLVMVTSCDLYDNLDTVPAQSLSDATAITNPNDAESALTGAYAAMNQDGYYGRMHVIWGENQFIYLGSNASTTRNSTFDSENNNVNPVDNTLLNTWDDIYEMADRTSNVITAVELLDASTFAEGRKNELLAEAHFLRALAHFDALRFFGRFWEQGSPDGIPLRLVPGNTTNKDLPRSTVAESYASIVSDLDFAINNAPDFSLSYLVSADAARALRARVALYMEDYSTAIDLVDDVVPNFELEANYGDIFVNRLASSELIFGMFANATVEQSGHSFFFISQANGGRQDYAPTTAFLNLISGDPREASVVNAIPEVLKYPNVNTQDDPTYIMRLAELHFIKAEALARQASPDLEAAKDELFLVSDRVGLPRSTATSIADFLDELQEEKVKEMAFEGSHAWFDAIRLGNVRTLKPSITTDDRLILPIPQTEVDTNAALEQNDSY